MFENWEHRQDVDEVMLGDAFLGINCQQLKINDYLTAKNDEILWRNYLKDTDEDKF